MTLNLIGLGLNDQYDITVRGLETIRKSDYIYLENYTSILQINIEDLEKYYGKEIIVADRNLVESNAKEILDKAKKSKVSFLVVGDVFGATTHTDLFLRAKENNIELNIINNTSILNAIGIVGLELYKYGKTTSIVFPQKNWLPHTPYEVIKNNKKNDLHTLCLLDIKVKESSPEDIRKGINKPQPPRYMTVNQAIETLLEIEKEKKENIFTPTTKCVGVARIGANYTIKYGTASELLNQDFGKPLHCLIIPGKTHFIEKDMLKLWKV